MDDNKLINQKTVTEIDTEKEWQIMEAKQPTESEILEFRHEGKRC